MKRIILPIMVAVQIVYSIVFIFSISASHVTGSANTITTPSNLSSNLIYFPISEGYVNGKIAHFIATDTSDNETATAIIDNLGYVVNYAPTLTTVPESARQQGYEFINGIEGEGAFGFQIPIATALPGDQGYSPIVQLNFVEWNTNIIARELKSVQEIMAAQSNGELTVSNTTILINSPAVFSCTRDDICK